MGLTQDFQLSCECRVCFIFMTWDRIPVKIGSGNSNPPQKNPNHRAGHPLYFKVIIWCCCHHWAPFDDFVRVLEKEFLLHFRSQFWSVQRSKVGSLQIRTSALQRNSSSCKFPVKNSLETNSERSQEPNSPNRAQGWICDQTPSSGCAFGVGKKLPAPFYLPRPGWEGSLGWAGPSFNPRTQILPSGTPQK